MEPGLFEILVVRELRKVGFAVERPPRARLKTLQEEPLHYTLEMRLPLAAGAAGPVRTLILACHEDRPMDRERVRATVERAHEEGGAAALIFATAGFDAAAVRAAAAEPVALFRIVDGRTAFDLGGWGPPGHYPAWLPEHVAQMAVPGPMPQPRYEITAAGQAGRILERISGASPPDPR